MFSQGAMAVPGDVTVALTGASATFFAGSLQPQSGSQPTFVVGGIAVLVKRRRKRSKYDRYGRPIAFEPEDQYGRPGARQIEHRRVTAVAFAPVDDYGPLAAQWIHRGRARSLWRNDEFRQPSARRGVPSYALIEQFLREAA